MKLKQENNDHQKSSDWITFLWLQPGMYVKKNRPEIHWNIKVCYNSHSVIVGFRYSMAPVHLRKSTLWTQMALFFQLTENSVSHITLLQTKSSSFLNLEFHSLLFWPLQCIPSSIQLLYSRPVAMANIPSTKAKPSRCVRLNTHTSWPALAWLRLFGSMGEGWHREMGMVKWAHFSKWALAQPLTWEEGQTCHHLCDLQTWSLSLPCRFFSDLNHYQLKDGHERLDLKVSSARVSHYITCLIYSKKIRNSLVWTI